VSQKRESSFIDPAYKQNALAQPPAPVVIYLLGSSDSGKSSLIKSFMRHDCADHCDLSSYVSFTDKESEICDLETKMKIFDERVYNNKRYKLEIRLPPRRRKNESPKEYKDRRFQSYEGVDVFLLCYSVFSRDALIYIQDGWVPEIRKLKKSFLIVGTKAEYRQGHPCYHPSLLLSGGKKTKQKKYDFVDAKAARRCAKRLGAAYYLECAALAGDCGANGVNSVFECAVMAYNRRLNMSCCSAECSIM